MIWMMQRTRLSSLSADFKHVMLAIALVARKAEPNLQLSSACCGHFMQHVQLKRLRIW